MKIQTFFIGWLIGFGLSAIMWFCIIAPPIIQQEQSTEYLYDAYSPLYRDIYVVKTDSALKPMSWYVDTLVHDTVIIISEYKPE